MNQQAATTGGATGILMLIGGVLVLILGEGVATAIFMFALGGGLTIGAAVPSALAGSPKSMQEEGR